MFFYSESAKGKECPECDGSGYDPYDGGQCDNCAGTGEVSCNNDD